MEIAGTLLAEIFEEIGSLIRPGVSTYELDLWVAQQLKQKGLISEMRTSNQVKFSEQNPTYLKLTFMEQALSHHYGALKSQPRSRIIYENEEVEKSQVVLAAQDLVDSTQKMLEEVKVYNEKIDAFDKLKDAH